MNTCIFCETNTSGYFQKWCPKCRALKHQILLWGDRIYDVVDSVMCRTVDKQDLKIKHEIKKEIENKAYNLRSTSDNDNDKIK
jgi:hypothetical protein